MPKLTKGQVNILMFGAGLSLAAHPILLAGGVGILIAMVVIEVFLTDKE